MEREIPMHVLLVEDDAVDREAIERAFVKFQVSNPYTMVTNGIDALARLRGADGKPPLPQPCVILLDLSLPLMNGFEFLSELRRDPELKRSIVFVLTTSNRAQDKLRAYERFIAGYIVKAHVAPSYQEIVRLLLQFGQTVEFPPSSNHEHS